MRGCEDEDIREHSGAFDVLAVSYAANGDIASALATQEKALTMLKADIQMYPYMEKMLAGYNSRLATYKAGKAWIYSEEDIRRCGYDPKRCLVSSSDDSDAE